MHSAFVRKGSFSCEGSGLVLGGAGFGKGPIPRGKDFNCQILKLDEEHRRELSGSLVVGWYMFVKGGHLQPNLDTWSQH